MRARAFVAVLVVVAIAWSAQAAADVVQKPAGDWRLSEVGGKIGCTLTLTRNTGVAGFELKAPLACRRAFPPLKAVAAWTLDDKGGLVLSDTNAQPIVTFPNEARGHYEAKAPDGRVWRLDPLKAAPAVPGGEESPIITAPGGI